MRLSLMDVYLHRLQSRLSHGLSQAGPVINFSCSSRCGIPPGGYVPTCAALKQEAFYQELSDPKFFLTSLSPIYRI